MHQIRLFKNVTRQFFIYGLGHFLNKGIAFLLLPVYTHYLRPKDYGILELLELTTYVIELVLGVGLTQAMVRFYHENSDPRSRNLVISSVFITTIAISVIALTGLIPFSGIISGWILKSPAYSQLFILIFVAMSLNMGIDVSMTYYRIKEMSVMFVSFSTAQLLLNLSFNLLFIAVLGMGIKGVIIGGLISSSMIGTILFINLIREVGMKFSWKSLAPMLKYGLPLIGTWLGMYLINFSDRFVLQRLLPSDIALSQIGIYSFAYKFGMLPSVMILSPFLMLWSPKQFQIVNEPDAPRVFSSIFSYFWFVQLFFGLGLCVFIRDIIRLISTPGYQDASLYVPLLALSYICYGAYSYMQFGILHRKNTRVLAINTLSMAVLNLALNFVLIPVFGVMGSAIATFVTIILMTLVTLFISQKLYPIPYQYFRLTKMTLLAVILYTLAMKTSIENMTVTIIIKLLFVLAYPAILYIFWISSRKESKTLPGFPGNLC